MEKTREDWLSIIKRDYHHLSEDEHEDLADHILKTHPDHKIRLADPEPSRENFWLRRIFWAILALIFATLIAPRLHAQFGTSRIDVITTKQSGSILKSFAAPFSIDCTSGMNCSVTGSVFTISATGVGGTVYYQTLQNNTAALTQRAVVNFWQGLSCVDNAGASRTDCGLGLVPLANGGTAYASNTGAAGKVLIGNGAGAFIEGDPLVQGVVAAGASLAAIAPVYIGGVDGSGNSKGLVVDASGRPTVNVNGTVPVSIATAPVLVAGSAIIGKVGIDQTTPGTTNGVQVNASLPAGTNVIGHVIADTGSTTAVTGNVTAVQATGTNLHAVIDSGSTTAVTQATGTNLHAVIDTGSTTAVTQATGTNLHMVVDSGTVTTVGAVTAITNALPAGSNIIGNFRIDQTTPGTTNGTQDASTSATGAAPPAKAGYVGYLGSGATGGFLTGATVGDTYKNINVSTATTTLLVTGVSGRQVRISAMHMITAAANNVALIEGTGATCGTGSAGMAGGTTAATGYNLAANGGIAFGSGLGTVMQTATTGDSVCVVTSANVQLSGGLQYSIY
jgi:hypothetical protein